MKTQTAKKIAIEEIKKHNLNDWSFKFDFAKSRFGQCNFRTKTITLSKELTELNEPDKVINTIKHEIAHALVGAGHGHNLTWKNKAVEVGCLPQRCYSKEVITPQYKYTWECPNCKRRINSRRKIKSSCYKCCNQFNNGKYTKKFKFKKVGLK